MEVHKPFLTIHTATYNRAHTLPIAYESLKKQSCQDFEWFVTDNGSTDNTEELFEKWSNENNKFKISYHKIPERGIPRAMNYGINHIESDYIFIFDSDDYLFANAVETIYEKIREIDNKDDYVGVGFVRVNRQGKPLKGIWPSVNSQGYVDCTNIERHLYNLDADMCEAYKIDIIKKYPYKVWENEIFAPEQLCMNAMALAGYKLRWYKIAIYGCEYLDGGLTKDNRIVKNNPMGFAMMHNQNLLIKKSFKDKFIAASNMTALSLVAGHPGYIFKSNNKLLSSLTFPYGCALAIRRYLQFKKMDD